MSIHTFKKKSIITGVGVKISGKPGYGIWLSQGPFGSKFANNFTHQSEYGTNGFSLQGGRRTNSYIGKTYAMSTNGTPFYGVFPVGNGGCCGTYPQSQPVFNCPEAKVITRGKQYQFIKPSVLSTKGMLEKKYMWINNGKYPNYWVQPVYCNNNLSDNASQEVYIHNKAAQNITVNNTNAYWKYLNHTGCNKNANKATNTYYAGCKNSTNANYNSYNIISSNGIYTKFLTIPQDSSQYTLQIQRKCANPIGRQKPFPFAWNSTHTATIGSLSSACVQTGSKGPATPLITPVYLEPPAWYTTPCNNVGQG